MAGEAPKALRVCCQFTLIQLYAWDATDSFMILHMISSRIAELDLPFRTSQFVEARKLILDEFGRELDEDGQVVPMKPQARELVFRC